MCVWFAAEALFLESLAWDVNGRLKLQNEKPITRKEYGWNFYNHVLSEHERLFPNSSKRTWWVLSCLLPVLGFLVWEIL
jgi:hypothetical protein